MWYCTTGIGERQNELTVHVRVLERNQEPWQHVLNLIFFAHLDFSGRRPLMPLHNPDQVQTTANERMQRREDRSAWSETETEFAVAE